MDKETGGRMEIITLEKQHLPMLTRLLKRVGYRTNEADVVERYEFAAEIGSQTMLAALLGAGHLAGYIHVVASPTLTHSPRAEVVGFLVEKTEDEIEIGKQLLTAAEKWSTQNGYPYMRVRSEIGQETAHQIYEGLGFIKVKTSHVYLKGVSNHSASEGAHDEAQSLEWASAQTGS